MSPALGKYRNCTDILGAGNIYTDGNLILKEHTFIGCI